MSAPFNPPILLTSPEHVRELPHHPKCRYVSGFDRLERQALPTTQSRHRTGVTVTRSHHYLRNLVALATVLDMRVEELVGGVPGYHASMSQRAALPQGHPTNNNLARCAIQS